MKAGRRGIVARKARGCVISVCTSQSEDEVEVVPKLAMKKQKSSRTTTYTSSTPTLRRNLKTANGACARRSAQCNCLIFNSKTSSSSQLPLRSQHKTEFQSRRTATHHVLTRLSAFPTMFFCPSTVTAKLSALRASLKVSAVQCSRWIPRKSLSYHSSYLYMSQARNAHSNLLPDKTVM